ncbi:ras-related protein Rap-1b-like [Parasteatoda tepidariorum]|uniref:ras-related protein Rap-1b-like n=1 Tax=Parasteatoda tepidariorum TaxID=114398 RepID=UPI00077FDB82|nr:ras-related protein Rap-1b-like [Parasteatoda tepidariorum]
MRESKFVVLGAGGVGKTSLVVRFLNDMFCSTYKPTVEDCYQHTIQLPDGISHTVEILDTAGSHHFPAMRELSIRSGRGFLLVYSVDSYQSFREATQLWQLIRDIRADDDVPVLLVGNKSDLEIHRQVTYDQALKRTKESMDGCCFYEASAKFNTNVKEVFLTLLQLARDQEEAQEALLEEQDLFRRKSRRLSKRISRKINNTFALKKNDSTTDLSDPVIDLKKDLQPKCVIV